MRGAAVSSYSGGCAKRLAWPVCHAWNTRAATVVDVARRDRRSKYTTTKLSVWRTAAASGAAASADTGSVAAGQGPRQQQQELVPQQQQLQQGKDKAPLLPVTVISGFLGAGKTTLLRHILENANGMRIGLLVNDMAALNIDERLLAGAAVQAAGDAELVALSSGCICCTIREDLVREVRALAEQQRFDVLVIESTGISLPLPVAATFAAPAGDGSYASSSSDAPSAAAAAATTAAAAAAAAAADMLGGTGSLGGLAGVARLDTLVTVVDGQRFVADVLEARALLDEGLQADEGDERTIADLLVEQVEFADVLLLNKADLLTEQQRGRLLALLSALNPAAKVVVTQHSSVPLDQVLHTGRFDLEAMQAAPGWLQELNRFEAAEAAAAATHVHNHSHSHSSEPHHHHHHHHRVSEAEAFGITSFVYHAVRPFHPARLLSNALSGSWPGVLRSKGFFWLATRHDIMGLWQSAGGGWVGEPSALWEAARGDAAAEAAAAERGALWHAVWGDRSQDIVWIGVDMDEASLRAMLDVCLLTDEEMELGPAGWADFEDPLPPWDLEALEDEEEEEWEEGEEEMEE